MWDPPKTCYVCGGFFWQVSLCEHSMLVNIYSTRSGNHILVVVSPHETLLDLWWCASPQWHPSTQRYTPYTPTPTVCFNSTNNHWDGAVRSSQLSSCYVLFQASYCSRALLVLTVTRIRVDLVIKKKHFFGTMTRRGKLS